MAAPSPPPSPSPTLLFRLPPALGLAGRLLSFLSLAQVAVVGAWVPHLYDAKRWEAVEGQAALQWQRDLAASSLLALSLGLGLAAHRTLNRLVLHLTLLPGSPPSLQLATLALPWRRWALPLARVQGVARLEGGALLLGLKEPAGKLLLHQRGEFPQRSTLLALLQRAVQGKK